MYPTRVLTTPVSPWNLTSGPQNQPSASVATCVTNGVGGVSQRHACAPQRSRQRIVTRLEHAGVSRRCHGGVRAPVRRDGARGKAKLARRVQCDAACRRRCQPQRRHPPQRPVQRWHSAGRGLKSFMSYRTKYVRTTVRTHACGRGRLASFNGLEIHRR